MQLRDQVSFVLGSGVCGPSERPEWSWWIQEQKQSWREGERAAHKHDCVPRSAGEAGQLGDGRHLTQASLPMGDDGNCSRGPEKFLETDVMVGREA